MIVRINKLDNFGRGITTVNNKITFIPHTLKGEVVDIKLTSTHKKYNEGKVIKYIETSPSRVVPPCPYYNKCGGCCLEELNYQDENDYKEEKVKELLSKFTGLDNNIVRDIIYDSEYNYRNKIILHGINKELGLYKNRTNEIISINNCYLVNNKINEVISILKEINIDIKEVLIRTNDDCTNTLVSIKGKINNINRLLSKVDILVVNDKLLTSGSSIINKIGNYKFYISKESFFQINSNLTKKIYDEILKIVKDIKPKNVLDLYCGTGTIGIYISEFASKIIGIDNNKSNICDCINNKKLNNIDNIDFIWSRVEDKIDSFNNIDLIIVDPPRGGLDKKTKENILRIKPKILIYTSCDVVTLMRDIKDLDYHVEYIQPFNNFPRTYHVECVALLIRPLKII